MRKLLKSQYQYSDYQIAQLEFLLKTLLSELSKMLIMGVLFYHKLPEYIMAIAILSVMRFLSGGLHCKKYWSCFLVSFSYVFLCIYVLPMIPINKLFQMVLLFACLITNYLSGPVTSEIHLPLSSSRIKTVQIEAFVFIFFFLVATYVFPENSLITVGFWIIVLHTFQLVLAKNLMKRRMLQ